MIHKVTILYFIVCNMNIIIVGGGTAGWMTATTLLSEFPNKKITLVESPNISNIGVGESTVAGGQSGFQGIANWLNLVGINDLDFMPHCDSIYKLSIAFKDWYRKDSGTFQYPFGQPRVLPNIGLDDWYFKKIFFPQASPTSDYANNFFPGMVLVNQNKSLFTDSFNSNSDHSELNEINDEVQLHSRYSYQFDATKFGIWLKDNYCNKFSNFTHILGEVEKASLDDNGIKYLILDDGRRLKADLFIDCTGFKSLLLKEFDVPFIHIDNYLTNNLAWATKIPYKDPETQIVNYTNCTAIDNGWVWEIPLWSRMGAGYVFSDEFVTKGHALCEFKAELQKKGYEDVEELDYHLISMRCGIHSKLWVKNTCAIGLSAGFIEPLQSNGLHCTYQFLFNLCRILERDHVSEWDRKEFTTKCHDDYYGFAATVVTNYALSHRDDSKYWREIQNKKWPEELFSPNCNDLSGKFHQAYRDRQFNNQFNSYSPVHILAAGMNWNPTDVHSIKYGGGNLDIMKKIAFIHATKLEERQKNWRNQIKDFPSPYQYLKKNIHES